MPKTYLLKKLDPSALIWKNRKDEDQQRFCGESEEEARQFRDFLVDKTGRVANRNIRRTTPNYQESPSSLASSLRRTLLSSRRSSVLIPDTPSHRNKSLACHP